MDGASFSLFHITVRISDVTEPDPQSPSPWWCLHPVRACGAAIIMLVPSKPFYMLFPSRTCKQRYIVLRRIVPCDSDSAMDGGALNFHPHSFYYTKCKEYS